MGSLDSAVLMDALPALSVMRHSQDQLVTKPLALASLNASAVLFGK
jgi:hypothetical protein